jgi:hypothetical protein
VGVLVLSQYVEIGLAMRLLADSAEGAAQFGASRRAGSAIDPIIVSTLLSERWSDDPLVELTPRERECSS